MIWEQYCASITVYRILLASCITLLLSSVLSFEMILIYFIEKLRAWPTPSQFNEGLCR